MSASTVYLIRSLGTVWGVAITSTIIQNSLSSGLPEALSGVPDKWKVTPSSFPLRDCFHCRGATADRFPFSLLHRLSMTFGTPCLRSTACPQTFKWPRDWFTIVGSACRSLLREDSGLSRLSQPFSPRARDCIGKMMRSICKMDLLGGARE